MSGKIGKIEKKPIVALIYDFDGTLAPGNMQEYSFIKSIGLSKEEFWGKTQVMAQIQDADPILYPFEKSNIFSKLSETIARKLNSIFLRLIEHQ